MEERRCTYCGRKLHPKLRKDARFCERTCKSNWHRWKKEHPASPLEPHDWFDRLPEEWKGIAYSILGFTPSGAIGYILRRIDSPHGNGIFCFPVPHRITKHADNTLRNTTYYRLNPFEVPRVPWTGDYEVLFYMADGSVAAPAGQSTQHIHITRATPRAAWDEQALWKYYPPRNSSIDSTVGSRSNLTRQIQLRAPANALGYVLRIDNSPKGSGNFMFPLLGRVSHRADGRLSDAPYFRLSPFELPMVPWPGNYTLYFTLPNMPWWLDSDPQCQTIYIGYVHPYADFDRRQAQPTVVITEAALVAAKHSQGPTRLIEVRRGLRRLPRRRPSR